MAGSITTVEVRDPHEITPVMWDLFRPTPTSAITPPQFLARHYRAGDWQRYKREKQAYRTLASVGKLGLLCFTRMVDREAVHMVIGSPGIDHCCLTFLQQGDGRLRRPNNVEGPEVGRRGGVVFHAEAGHELETGRASIKTNVWIPAGLLRRLAAEMGVIDLDALNWTVGISNAHAYGAGLQRMTEWMFEEIARPDSPLANEIAATAAQDLLLRTIVLALTRGVRLRDGNGAAAPASVRRAEEFMRDKADQPLTVEAIAAAVGCSSRALQAAFREFRGVSPMSALRRVRLELAHAEIMRSDKSSPINAIAARYGFSNPGRFAAQYQRAFGARPSEIARTRPARRPDAPHNSDQAPGKRRPRDPA
jgi:AraC-like DNA-binding protein